MTSRPDLVAALEAVEEILGRGGDADEVLRAVLAALHEHGVAHAAVRFVENDELVDGPSIGEEAETVRLPVLYEGTRVGELSLATSDTAFAERLATLISPYVLVGWDTSGEAWAP
jgi:hypothetical protein